TLAAVEDLVDELDELVEPDELDELEDEPKPAPVRRGRPRKPATAAAPAPKPRKAPEPEPVEDFEDEPEEVAEGSSDDEIMCDLIREELGVELDLNALNVMLRVADFYRQNEYRLVEPVPYASEDDSEELEYL
ncbi:MAG: hypothetical protein ACREOZ_00630, partial [Gloeomargaritales cyanobacterium]